MKRKDKEINDLEEITETINQSKVCRLALSKNDIPYLIPLSFGYDGNYIFIHTAKEGKKNELPRSKLSRFHQRNPSLIAASSGVFNSFIPIRFAIGIRSTYIFQFTFPLQAGQAVFEI